MIKLQRKNINKNNSNIDNIDDIEFNLNNKNKEKNQHETKKVLKTVNLTLERDEIIFIRDLFSILMPPNGEITLSQSLAKINNNENIESKVWEKIYDLCQTLSLGVAQNAPDFILTIEEHPPLSIMKLPSTNNNREQNEENKSDNKEGKKDLFEIILNNIG